jgi:hypothetical protein
MRLFESDRPRTETSSFRNVVLRSQCKDYREVRDSGQRLGSMRLVESDRPRTETSSFRNVVLRSQC